MLFDVLDIVQNTAVLIAAVALELAFCAKAPMLDNARAAAKHTHFEMVRLQVVNAALLEDLRRRICSVCGSFSRNLSSDGARVHNGIVRVGKVLSVP